MASINQDKTLGSPACYAAPEVNFMSNGRTMAELNQILAAGHSLALCDIDLPLENSSSPWWRFAGNTKTR
jgi:hypothetical protein